MTVSLIISVAAVASALLCAAFAFMLSRGPGWSDIRWFGPICVAGAGYVFFTLPENGVGPDAWVPTASSFALACGAAHGIFWFRFVAALDGRRPTRVERVFIAILLGCGVAACVPGLLVHAPVVPRDNHWFAGQHRDPTASPEGWVVFLTFFAVSVAMVVRMLHALARGKRQMLFPALGLSMLTLATGHDTLASAHVYRAPSLAELALVGLLASVMLGITARITESARALVESRAELERTQGELIDRERLAVLGEVSAVIAHEVRNPLGVIYGTVATLHRTADSETTRSALDIVKQEAESLNRIVADLLQLARPAAPRLTETQTRGLLEDATASAVRALGQDADAVRVTVGDDVETIECDAAMLHHAISNLVMNALQAEARKTPVQVRAERVDGHVRIAVSDDGIGVAPDVRERLFKPFFTTRAKGTGLGLALVAKVAKGHGGLARYEPGVDGGATFVLELPTRRP
jgi:signal transduction histidine kinase